MSALDSRAPGRIPFRSEDTAHPRELHFGRPAVAAQVVCLRSRLAKLARDPVALEKPEFACPYPTTPERLLRDHL
jgi:hypothetical protein